jgi:uncharacterized membrane protein YhaH (DUF805 family)
MSYDAPPPPPPPPPPYQQPSYGGGFGPGDGGALRGATMPQAVQRFFTKYAEFGGRASRSEFWWAYLALIVVYIVLYVLARVSPIFSVLLLLFALAILVPTWALSARRLHDTGRSGWWQLLGLIPCVGTIILIVWYATPPRPEGNRFSAV